jgi:hypothetical protein
MVFLTCLTMISESLKTFNYLTFKSMDFFIPCTRASYSALLFMHSNSSLQDMKFCLPFLLMMMHPTPDPSYDLDPLKYKSQNYGKKPINFLFPITFLLSSYLFHGF